METDWQQKEIIEWVGLVLGESMEGAGFHELFKDGVRFCKLLCKVTSLNIRYKQSNQIFVQRENICSFINGLKALNMNEYELFQTNDLFERKDLRQVVICIYALSRQLQKEKMFEGPFIGPHLATKSKIEFSQEVLDRSKFAIHLQMGYSDPEVFGESKTVPRSVDDLKTNGY
ncbi:calponin [Ordospora colligata]|uniref:Calponin n=1 Tax=Ordospora colligata OC4 TaxID=1354746 RepID=A0A0B2UG62_9MICR|nr:calponin [Ordospora colligata OC4]KHN70071.1 calponin [Ordospora colligata OC4]TBU16453.1 calponin [Ordospora colligata]TBU16638.1 calponin [Ordospora colligata]TBU19211.1 calponin [Ordospora colligata]